MKIVKSVLSILFIVCLTICLPKQLMASSANEIEDMDIGDEYLNRFLKALEEGNELEAGDLFDEQMLKNSDHPFTDLIQLWNGRKVTDYSKISESIVKASGNSPKKTTYEYEVRSNDELFLVDFSLYHNDGKIKMASFNINFNLDPIGGIGTWRKYNWIQWLVTIIGICEIIFSIYVTQLCLKNGTKHKIFWCLVVLLVYGGVYFAHLGDDIQVGAYIYLLKLPQLLIYPQVGWHLTMSLPIGAIIYYIKVKRMKSPNIDG